MQLKWAQFDAFTRELSRLTGAELPAVVDSEIAAILAKASRSRLLKKATRRTIDKSMENYGPNWRVSNATWRKWQSKKKRIQKAKYARIGLSSSSMYQLSLHLQGRADRNMAAKAMKAERPQNWQDLAKVRKSPDPFRYFVDLIHGGAVLRWTGARRALFAATAGRIRFFEMNLKQGAFSSAKKAAAKYPGITVTRRGTLL